MCFVAVLKGSFGDKPFVLLAPVVSCRGSRDLDLFVGADISEVGPGTSDTSVSSAGVGSQETEL